jgi:anti-sigma regulatory factor (Ser/Thr protein kinase)
VPPPSTLTIPADVHRLKDVRQFVREAAGAHGADAAAIEDLVQAVDEWVTNIILHGYRGEEGPIEVELAREGGAVVVHIRDEAAAFNPETAPAFDPGVPLQRRPIGKMGIHLIRELCDRFEYRVPAGGGNEVELGRTMKTAPKPQGGTA